MDIQQRLSGIAVTPGVADHKGRGKHRPAAEVDDSPSLKLIVHAVHLLVNIYPSRRDGDVATSIIGPSCHSYRIAGPA